MIKLRRVGSPEVIAYQVDGTNPCYIDIPVYYTHNLANTGKTDLLTIFWTNEIFDKRDPDTYYEEV
jgi:UDP-2-acetamido-2,6-beta-L-arabino-hexul-4-ose reductase